MALRMFIFNQSFEINVIEGIIAFIVSLINYLASRKDFGYTREVFPKPPNFQRFIGMIMKFGQNSLKFTLIGAISSSFLLYFPEF